MKRYLLLIFISFLSFAQQIDKVDFVSCDAFLSPIASTKSIFGKISYEFKVIKSIDTIKIDAINMEFFQVQINGKSVNFKNSGKTLDLFEGLKKGKNILTFNYAATPKQALYFNGENENLQIWTQGQGKYTSHWLPSFDDVNEKVVFNISIAFREFYNFFSNGKFKKSILTKTSKIKYFQMQKPMSSYLVMLAIGNFIKKEDKSKSGTPLEFYLDEKDSLKFEPTYRYSKQMFDFLEKEIGVKYPWEVYRQVPVRDFLYAGMENTTSTIFSQDFVVDEIGFNDRNYLNVNAHELAHQWFGNLITAKESKHHWLQEGFATYYALLAEKELFGEDYFHHQLYLNALELRENAQYDTIPILNEKASSLTFYKKGAWALHVLRTSIGEEKFRKAVKSYLKKYAYKNVDTEDFLNEIKKVTNFDISHFKNKWLLSADFDWNEAMRILKSNQFISQLEEVRNLEAKPFQQKKNQLLRLMQDAVYFPIKQEILYQIETIPYADKQEFMVLALNSNDIKVRQTVIETVDYIPNESKSDFETLLTDKSYITREIALYRLFKNFPEERKKYLDLAKNWEGLNYNLKLAYLTLHFVNNLENNVSNESILSELAKFIKEPYDAKTRENALDILIQFQLISDEVLLSLIDLSLHHKWQTVKYAKDTLRTLIKNPNYKNQLENLKNKVKEAQKSRIDYFLNE
jgi:aminopeptidase N